MSKKKLILSFEEDVEHHKEFIRHFEKRIDPILEKAATAFKLEELMGIFEKMYEWTIKHLQKFEDNAFEVRISIKNPFLIFQSCLLNFFQSLETNKKNMRLKIMFKKKSLNSFSCKCLSKSTPFSRILENKITYKVFNVGQFDHYAEVYGLTEFTFDSLYEIGAVAKTDKVKVLGTGELKGKFSFKVHAISEKAKSLIEAAGGTIEILN